MTGREFEQVKKMWLQGYSATQIARVLPYKEYICIREISKLKKEGVLPSRSVQEIKAKAVIEEFQENKNLQEIADKLGIKMGYVREILNKHGIKHPKIMEFSKRQPSARKQEILNDLSMGMSQSAIAKKHGVSRQFVFQIARGIR
jgi:transposase